VKNKSQTYYNVREQGGNEDEDERNPSPATLEVYVPTRAQVWVKTATAGINVSGVADIPVATLRAVLLHHVAPGERFSGDVVGSTRVRTLNGDFLFPSVRGGSAYVDGAQIVIADVDASNGVIHVIDQVLVPGS